MQSYVRGTMSLIWVLGALAVLIGGTGCDRLSRYKLDAKFYDRETGKPVANLPVAVKLNLQGDSWGKDLRWDQQDFQAKRGILDIGAQELKEGSTDENGDFALDVAEINTPELPAFLIRVGGPKCPQLWGVDTSGRGLEYRQYDPSTGEYLEVPDSAPGPIAGKVSWEARYPKTDLEVRWDEKVACSEVEKSEKTEHRPPLGHNIVFASYADLLPHGAGAGYIRSFGNSGLLRLEVPFTLDGRSFGVATLAKLRLIPIWRIVFGLGAGIQHVSLDTNSLPGRSFVSSDTGIHLATEFSVDYSPRTGLYAEAGFSSLNLGHFRTSDHAFVRVGWVF